MAHFKFLLTFIVTTTILPAFCQVAEGDSVNLLKIYHYKKPNYVLLMEGEYVSYKTVFQETKRPQKGILKKITASDSLLIDSQKVAIADLEMIMSITHKRAIKSKNIGLAAVGGLATIAGVGLLVLNQNNSALIGTAGLLAGFSVLISAIIPLSHSNHYSTQKGWQIKRIKTIIEDEDELLDHY